MLDAALRIAAKGTPVFPCGPDKAPRVTGGFKSASTDPEVIKGWGDLWLAGAMIGAAIPEGLVVIDVDPRNGGEDTLGVLPIRDAIATLSHTRTVRTKSGGWHFYFRVPEETALRPILGPGVDVKRAGKGYVIVPPSAGYRFVQGGDAATIPPWLLEELAVEERTAQHEAAASKFGKFEKGTSYGIVAMQRQLGRLVTAQDGERNNSLNRAAFSLAQLVAGGELDEGTARRSLFDVAMSIGLEEEETHKTIESGWLAGEKEPWQAPDQQAGSTGDAERRSAPAATGTALPAATPAEVKWVNWSEDEPDLPFYAWPMLPKNAYVLAYGATEASKSMAWVGLLCEASHHDIRTSVYSLENPPATDRQRVRRWRPYPANFRLTNDHIDFNDGRQLDALRDREADWGDGRGTDVILIDTYSHAFHSYSDDGNAKAIAFAQRVRWLMAEVGCSVVVIDHTGYMQQDEPRDASAKRQQVDVAILMKKNGVWQLGQPARFTMENKKAARFANPFFLTGEILDDATVEPVGLRLGWIGDSPRWDS